MIIVGVRFKDVGRIYYFDPGNIDLTLLVQNVPVIVETGRGAEYGLIALEKREVAHERLSQPVRKVLRLATPEDEIQEEINRAKEAEARDICQQKIEEHALAMHLVDVDLTFDLSKIIFFFTADGRIDFRELVKDLASTFKMRIELRQIGVRDEAKMINGVGICGRTLCCATFLDEFQPVSIKSAKDQGLSLNPTKISGICGKLMCCLKYEEETYAFLNASMPCVGDIVETPDGKGEVIQVNILRQQAKVHVGNTNNDAPVSNVYDVKVITVKEHKQNCEKNCGSGKCGAHGHHNPIINEDYV